MGTRINILTHKIGITLNNKTISLIIKIRGKSNSLINTTWEIIAWIIVIMGAINIKGQISTRTTKREGKTIIIMIEMPSTNKWKIKAILTPINKPKNPFDTMKEVSMIDNLTPMNDTRTAMKDNQIIMKDNRITMKDNQITMIDSRITMKGSLITMKDNRIIMIDNRIIMIDNLKIMKDNLIAMKDNLIAMKDNRITMTGNLITRRNTTTIKDNPISTKKEIKEIMKVGGIFIKSETRNLSLKK